MKDTALLATCARAGDAGHAGGGAPADAAGGARVSGRAAPATTGT